MSRCFPFPPPGYQRKTVPDVTDLLRKEKHKEKKHKKEKKDKEKKEGKEKHEKERNDKKHREDKDKREKHRDKKKDKEKGRDKDRHKNDVLLSVEKKVVQSTDNHVHRPSEKSKDRENDRIATSADKSISGLSAVQNGMLVSRNNHHVSETKSFKYAPGVGRKSMDDERRTFNQLPDKNIGAERKKDEGELMLAARSRGTLLESKERTKEKPGLDRRVGGRGVCGDAKSSGIDLVPAVTVVQNNVGGSLRHGEKKIEHKMDGMEKIREKEGDDRKGDKRKVKDRENPVKDKVKEEKKEDIVKGTTDEKHIEVVTRMKDGSENHMLKPSAKDISGVQSIGSPLITKDSNHHAATVNNNLRKRTDSGLNGIYDEFVTRPNKLARTTVSPHTLTENGRSLEPCQNSAVFDPITQRPPMNNKVERDLSHDDTQRPSMKIKMDGRECKMNGTSAEPCLQSSRETTVKAERKAVAPIKPPHPDAKYLGQVLSVPKMDEWSDFDDQEWLFNRNSSSTTNIEVQSSGIDEMPQVWARALWLGPVDVYALPYVIPY